MSVARLWCKVKPTERSVKLRLVESLRIGLSCECCVPQFRHRGIAPAEFARLKLPLLDFLCQLDSGDRYDRVVESLESQHRPDSLLHSPMILLHQVVQVLAGSNLDATRKFAVFLHLPHRPVRGRIGVQGDLRGHSSVLHCAAQKRFGGVHVPVPAQKEIDRLIHLPLGMSCFTPYERDGIPFGAIEKRTPFSTLYSTILFSRALALRM